MKKLLAMLLCVAMVLGTMGTVVFADEAANVAAVGSTEYATIEGAIAEWTAGTTLTLLKDVTLSDVIQLKSTEHHILNLGTHTMTAASGKNAIEIIACGTGDSERTAITINADATNPGGINAGSKSVVYYDYSKGGISGNDRPIIKITGGVFTGSTSSLGSGGIYFKGKATRQCATLNISGGTFNCSILGTTKSKMLISGGTFNYSVGSQGDSTCYRLISGGTFKSFGFMTADAATKFGVGSALSNYNVGTYVDDNGYLVVGGPVVNEPGEKFEASSANYGGWSSYLQYSSAAANSLYYTSVKEALADNNKTSGSVTVYVDELDMAGISYKGTIVVPEDHTITITNAPATLVVKNVAGDVLTPDGNGTYGGVEEITPVVAKIGDAGFETLQKAVDTAQAGDVILVVANISGEAVNVNKDITITGGETVALADEAAVTLTDVSINAVDGCKKLTVNNLKFTGNSWINSGAADTLTVSNVTADVTPSNATYTNSRGAFISLGRSEQKELKLVVKDCNIVSKSGTDPILGWAAITEATITGNTFGSASAHQANSDSVKFMAIADGALFTITDNTVYSDYNGFVFGQNTTRGNAYTAKIERNTFIGSADHVWIEVSGADTTHATILATSDNTVNGANFTASDIKASSGIKNWTSFAGVDVKTDANGKVIGGQLAFAAEGVIADGYRMDGNGNIITIPVVAKIGNEGFETLQMALDYASDAENIVIDLVADATLDITAWQTLAIGGDATETITINGNENTLTFNKKNSDWNHVATNNDAKLILNNMTINDSGYNDGPWNRYDLNFGCDVELNAVTATKALAFKADATLNGVTINETTDVYAIWIQPNGQNVSIDGLTVTSAGRGIKIDEQYVDASQKVTLTVEDATFKTAKKAAILVKSKAGADIELESIDISGVAADTVNAVWSDADNGAYYSLINVTGGTLGQEDASDFAAKVVSGGNTTGYYKTFADALAVAKNGDEVVILAAGTYKVPANKNITITGAVDGVEFDMSAAVGVYASMTFNNVTFRYQNQNYTGLQHAGDMVYNECTFYGQPFLYGTSETFNDCEFNQDSSDAYNVWTYGAKKVDFNRCTFNSAGKSVLVYSEDKNLVTFVSFTGSKLIASTPVAGKAAIEIDSSLSTNGKYTIEVNNTTATGFAEGNVSGKTLWNNKKGNNAVVKVDGILYLVPVVAKLDGVEYESLQNAINAANGNGTIVLVTDTAESVTIGEAATYALRNSGLTIDLANFTLTGSVVVNSGTVEIINGTIVNGDASVSAITSSGTLKLENLNISSVSDALSVLAGTVTIKSGSYAAGGVVIRVADDAAAIIEDGSFASESGDALDGQNITITGGLFKEKPDEGYIAEGYEAITVEGGEFAYSVVAKKASAVKVVFAETDDEDVYDIKLVSTDEYEIYKFVGAELTFKNDSKTVANEDMRYEILGLAGVTDADKSFEKADTYALRLIDNAEPITGKDFVIGQVKFIGRGTINFAVTEGKVVATQFGKTLERYYVADTDELTADTLLLADSKITDGTVEEATGTVTVKVAYNHLLDGTYWEDNQITVTLKDAFGATTDAMDISGGEVSFTNVKLGKVIITLEAPGFRKYVYQTKLESRTEPLVLQFWNEVKTGTAQAPKLEIEVGKGLEEKNFLVGDIVMDYIIDEYDLAAVTSYYGTYNLTDAEKHMKYDLNRDGNIDIMDVAYVLHGYNK